LLRALVREFMFFYLVDWNLVGVILVMDTFLVWEVLNTNTNNRYYMCVVHTGTVVVHTVV